MFLLEGQKPIGQASRRGRRRDRGYGRLRGLRFQPRVEVLEDRRQLSFSAAQFQAGQTPTSVAVGDFNGDGKPDVVTGDRGGNTLSTLL
jgi:hypothetical protein